MNEEVKKWPTPISRDWKGKSQRGCDPENRDCLSNVFEEKGDPGQLNPDWVDLLMGYPMGWTDEEKDFSIFLSDKKSIGGDVVPDWNPGWEDGVPRVAVGKKKRAHRLKGLGNAIVPQIAMILFKLIAPGLNEN